MEETELSFTTTAWLQEGLWLKEMVIRLAGASLSLRLLKPVTPSVVCRGGALVAQRQRRRRNAA